MKKAYSSISLPQSPSPQLVCYLERQTNALTPLLEENKFKTPDVCAYASFLGLVQNNIALCSRLSAIDSRQWLITGVVFLYHIYWKNDLMYQLLHGCNKGD